MQIDRVFATWLVLIGGVAAGFVIGTTLLRPNETESVDSPLEEIEAPPSSAPGTSITSTPTGAVYPAPSSDDSDNANASLRMAPDFSLPDLDGQEHRLSDYYGQVVLLNFWTTWCPPCREEMPVLQEVFDEYHEQGFAVLGVNLYQLDNRGEIENFVGELGISFPILLDRESIVSQQLYRVIGIPTSVFIDRTGMIVEIIVGAIPIDTLEPMVHELVKR